MSRVACTRGWVGGIRFHMGIMRHTKSQESEVVTGCRSCAVGRGRVVHLSHDELAIIFLTSKLGLKPLVVSRQLLVDPIKP